MREHGDRASSRTTSNSTTRDQGTTVHTATQTLSTFVGAKSSVCTMIPRRYFRFVVIAILAVSMATVYVTMFHHPPPDELLKMNGGGDFSLRAFENGGGGSESELHARTLRESQRSGDDMDSDGAGGEGDEEDGAKIVSDLMEGKDVVQRSDAVKESPKQDRNTHSGGAGEATGQLKGKAAWDKFIADNHYTVIGVVLDTCDHPQEQLGVVVLMEDKETGGVKSRTFYNFTLERELDEGTFNIDVKYNGQDLYDNWWELCEMEEDEEDLKKRTFVCPIKPGPIHLVKDKHIPGYLPKGRYQTKAWVMDEKRKVLVCGLSDFKI